MQPPPGWLAPDQSAGGSLTTVIAAASAGSTRTELTRVNRKSFLLFPAASAPPSTRCGTMPAVVRAAARSVAHEPPLCAGVGPVVDRVHAGDHAAAEG